MAVMLVCCDVPLTSVEVFLKDNGRCNWKHGHTGHSYYLALLALHGLIYLFIYPLLSVETGRYEWV